MNQTEYLKSLKIELERANVDKVEEILLDYQEHFAHALRSGKSESEVVQKLGLPHVVAAAYKTDSVIKQASSSGKELSLSFILSSIGRLILIAPFNFLVIFFPGMVTGGVLIAGWVTTLAIVIVAATLLFLIPGVFSSTGSGWALLGLVFSSLGTFAVAALAVMIMHLFTKYVALAVMNYLRWNLKFILSK